MHHICVRIQTQDNSPGDHTVNCHRCLFTRNKINPEVVGGELAMRVGWGSSKMGPERSKVKVTFKDFATEGWSRRVVSI